MSQRVAVIVMGKRPVPGRTKTRLVGHLSAEQAAELSAAMLADRVEQVRGLPGVLPAVALFGSGEAGCVAGQGVEVLPQLRGGLGEGLEGAARHFIDRGMPAVLVDADSPTLPTAWLVEAVETMRSGSHDLVLGPAEDGGYYLLGLRKLRPELFRDMPWSTPRVVPETLERAAALGLETRLLPRWFDVDRPADLRRLEHGLLDASWPPRTAAWLRSRREAAAPAAPPPSPELWDRPWRRLGGRLVYRTPWLGIREDRVLLPNGGLTTYGVVDCGECVGVLPFHDDGSVLMVRQYRYVAGRVTLEMPTGGVHPGETPEAAALRELAEEAQVSAGRLEPLGVYHTSKSVMDETAWLYAAHDLSPVRARGDDTEFIARDRMPFGDVLAAVLSGEITDSMTIIAVLRAALDT